MNIPIPQAYPDQCVKKSKVTTKNLKKCCFRFSEDSLKSEKSSKFENWPYLDSSWDCCPYLTPAHAMSAHYGCDGIPPFRALLYRATQHFSAMRGTTAEGLEGGVW